jgi:hypothetical protein
MKVNDANMFDPVWLLDGKKVQSFRVSYYGETPNVGDVVQICSTPAYEPWINCMAELIAAEICVTDKVELIFRFKRTSKVKPLVL